MLQFPCNRRNQVLELMLAILGAGATAVTLVSEEIAMQFLRPFSAKTAPTNLCKVKRHGRGQCRCRAEVYEFLQRRTHGNIARSKADAVLANLWLAHHSPV